MIAARRMRIREAQSVLAGAVAAPTLGGRFLSRGPVGELMRLPLAARDVPGRLATGGYVLYTGISKWNGTPETAAVIHDAAVTAFPFLKDIPPEKFLRMLAVGEIATGTALLLPLVPSKLAGLALAGFSSALLTMYWRTPGMHKPGSIWPTLAGTAVSKDVWMLGIGLGLLMSDS